MTNVAAFCLGGAAGYLIGSIPFGLLAAKYAAGVDIRTEGSGNIGATNVARVVGAKWGAAVLVLDCIKGLLPVLLLRSYLLADTEPTSEHLLVVCGVATVLGHLYPLWLRFRGGKGVATSLGVIVILAPKSTLAAVAVFGITMALFRIVALSSVLSALGFAISQIVLSLPAPFGPQQWSLTAFSLAVPLLIVVRHRSNLRRLVRGEEERFEFRQSRKE